MRKDIIRYIIAIVVLFIAIYLDSHKEIVFQTQMDIEYPTALMFYPLLKNIDFDTAYWNNTTKEITCVNTIFKNNSGVADEIFVDAIRVDNAVENIYIFKAIRTLSNGIFFIDDINVNGECDGLFLHEETFEEYIKLYSTKKISKNADYLTGVPYLLR